MHAGGPLADGTLDGEYITCPWHNWKYHCRTGLGEPGFEADAVPRYDFKIEGEHLFASEQPATKRTHGVHPPHRLSRRIERAPGPVRVVGISTTNMGPTAELWYRPAGEAIGLILLLAAMHLAFNYADAADYRRRAILIALCALGILLTKEMLVALLPAGWLFSRLRIEKREWSWAPWTYRDTFLFGVVALAIVIAGAPIAYYAMHAPAASYAGQYAAASVPCARRAGTLADCPDRHDGGDWKQESKNDRKVYDCRM